MNDRNLARRYPWMNRRVLCEMLGQPYIAVPAGTWWLKPAVSEDGLGVDTHRLVCDEPMILMPEAEGEYLCVDVRREMGHPWTEAHSWEASRSGLFFRWLRYAGRLSPDYVPDSRLGLLLATVPRGEWINVEYLGDTVIEAHGRRSEELLETIGAEGHGYHFPIWTGSRAPEQTMPVLELPDVCRVISTKIYRFEDADPVQGCWRLGALNVDIAGEDHEAVADGIAGQLEAQS